MVDGYPEKKAPEIRLIKRKGLTTGQIQSLFEKIQKKSHDMIGSEMIFDLVDEAKALLSVVAKKKVSFHDEMTTRRAADEQQIKAVQKERQARLDEAELHKRNKVADEIDLKIRKEIEVKEKLFQELLQTEDTLTQPSLLQPQTKVIFVPELVFPVNGVATTVSTILVRSEENPVSWTFGEISRAFSSSGLEFCLLIVKFTAAFFSSSQGKRKLDVLVRAVKEMATGLPGHEGLVRVLGAQVEMMNFHPVLQILMEPLKGNRLDLILKQAGSLNMEKSTLFLKQVLASLGHLHLNGVVHRDVRLSNIFVSSDGSTAKLAFPVVSRALLGKTDSFRPINIIRSGPVPSII